MSNTFNGRGGSRSKIACKLKKNAVKGSIEIRSFEYFCLNQNASFPASFFPKVSPTREQCVSAFSISTCRQAQILDSVVGRVLKKIFDRFIG